MGAAMVPGDLPMEQSVQDERDKPELHEPPCVLLIVHLLARVVPTQVNYCRSHPAEPSRYVQVACHEQTWTRLKVDRFGAVGIGISDDGDDDESGREGRGERGAER